MVSLFLLGCIVSLFTCTLSLECHKRSDGAFELREGDQVVPPEEFDCISITKPDETTITVRYLEHNAEGQRVCQIVDDGVPKDKKIYARSDVPTGTRCNYVCRDSTGLFKCDSPTLPTDNACTCHPAEHRMLIRPVHQIGGQSEREEGETCEGKTEGYIFGDAVTCSSMRAPVHKQRVNFIKGRRGQCTAVTSTREETRYTEASDNELNLEGCLYVCKQAGPECQEEVDNGRCSCESPGLTKRLVPMDEVAVRTVLRQTVCTPGNCGPCGRCNEVTGACDLLENAHEGDYCECGEICPHKDLRAIENRGGQILCRPNVSLDCMKKPKWLNSLFDNSEPGTRFPNLCRTGRVDASDTCSCAPGHVEQPGPFSGVYCVRS